MGLAFVGSHACKALAVAGYLPVVSIGNRWAVRYGPLEIGAIWIRPACTRCSGSTARLL